MTVPTLCWIDFIRRCRRGFGRQFGEPTPAQRLGWPAIASGQTFADRRTDRFRQDARRLSGCARPPLANASRPEGRANPLRFAAQGTQPGRLAQPAVPLEGILARSEAIGTNRCPRSGSRSAAATRRPSERAAMVRKPPDILITTPESLHLMLTSRAREILRGHLARDRRRDPRRLRQQARCVPGAPARATGGDRRPRVSSGSACRRRSGRSMRSRAIWAGFERAGGRRRPAHERAAAGHDRRRRLAPRPGSAGRSGRVRGPTVVAGSIWPEIEAELLSLVREHRSTIIFANNRRTVEKLTARLNELAAGGIEARQGGNAGDDDRRHGRVRAPFRAHHGSISLEERRATEEALKQGELTAVVATASLELGIDMGAVDLVCQVESPGNVAQGLAARRAGGARGAGREQGPADRQDPGRPARIGRALPRHAAGRDRALAGAARLPRRAGAASDRVRGDGAVGRARAFRPGARRLSLPRPLGRVVRERSAADLGAVSHRRVSRPARARVVWDRIHNRLAALPGTAQLALVGGGTIPDTGQFPVYLGEGGPRLGELDEEFVYERRVGETFVLGNSTWRIDAIEPHRVRGRARPKGKRRSCRSGAARAPRARPSWVQAVGALCREVPERLDDPELLPWLERECRLTPAAPPSLRHFIRRQERLAGAVPDDRTIVIETFLDPAGELGPGRPHAVRRQAAPCAQTCPAGTDPPAVWADRRPVCTPTTACCSGCRRWTSRRSTSSTD